MTAISKPAIDEELFYEMSSIAVGLRKIVLDAPNNLDIVDRRFKKELETGVVWLEKETSQKGGAVVSPYLETLFSLYDVVSQLSEKAIKYGQWTLCSMKPSGLNKQRRIDKEWLVKALSDIKPGAVLLNEGIERFCWDYYQETTNDYVRAPYPPIEDLSKGV